MEFVDPMLFAPSVHTRPAAAVRQALKEIQPQNKDASEYQQHARQPINAQLVICVLRTNATCHVQKLPLVPLANDATTMFAGKSATLTTTACQERSVITTELASLDANQTVTVQLLNFA